ncbi:MAG: cytidylyltransferase domain-containing protein [Vicinamibacterales bacterium]
MRQTRPGIVLQARFASTRLPGKALEPIGSRVMLEHCLRRLLAAGEADVVLATTTNVEDDALEELATHLGVRVFRGDADDVLGRYVAAALRFRLDPVIRATADNPAVDMDATGRVLRGLAETGADYVREDGLPVGAGVEGMSTVALRRAVMAAPSAYDREHVTTYIKSQPHAFKVVTRPAPAALRRPDIRLTVDTRDDLQHVRTLFERTAADMPTVRQLIEAAGPAADAAQEVA